MCDSVDLCICLHGLATEVDQRKSLVDFKQDVTSDFQKISEQFVQLHARHFKISNFFTFLIKCGIVMRALTRLA